MAFNAQQVKRMRVAVLIAVGAIVVVIAVVVFSGAFAGSGTAGGAGASDTDTTQPATDTAYDGAATSGDDATTSDEHDMSHVDATYSATVEQLQAQFDADPSNPSALLQLANGYFDWGVAALDVVVGDEDQAHVTDLFNQAIARYDDYLEANPDSKSVQVDRAISIFYTGETDRAIEELEDFVAADDSFGPAWANLGMFYESAGRTDEARDAYERAIEADSSDAYGVKAYAEQRLEALGDA